MIIGKVSEKYSEILYKVNNENVFLQLLENLSNVNSSFPKKLSLLIDIAGKGDPGRTWNAINNIPSQTINEVNEAIKSVRTSYIYTTANTYLEILNKTDEIPLANVTEALNIFIYCLDEHLQSASFESCKELASAAENLRASIKSIELVSATIEPTQGNTALPNVSIYISDHTDLDEFSSKLSALTKIIESACNLLQLSMTEADVAIERIESGSFFAKISANPLVISVITVILTNGSQYLLNQPTERSDEAIIRERSETLINVLKLKEALDKNGLPVTELDSELRSSAVIITKQLNNLIGKSKKIEINKNSYTTDETMLLANIQDAKKEP